MGGGGWRPVFCATDYKFCTDLYGACAPGEAEEIYDEPFGTAGMGREVRNGCITRTPDSLPRYRDPQMSTKETEKEIDN